MGRPGTSQHQIWRSHKPLVTGSIPTVDSAEAMLGRRRARRCTATAPWRVVRPYAQLNVHADVRSRRRKPFSELAIMSRPVTGVGTRFGTQRGGTRRDGVG